MKGMSTNASKPKRRMSFSYWWDKFVPTGSPAANGGPYIGDTPQMFETFGTDRAAVEAQAARDISKVWTLIDDGVSQTIAPGVHLVNRMGFFITRQSWVDELRDVKVD